MFPSNPVCESLSSAVMGVTLNHRRFSSLFFLQLSTPSPEGMWLLYRDGCLKFFQKPLEAKQLLKNRSKGIDIASALTSSSNNQVCSWRRRFPLDLGLKNNFSLNPACVCMPHGRR